jgi:ankyrin repeat protein
MRVVMLRFPHLAEQILQKLDNEGLAKSREVQRCWQKFIDERDYPWLRIVNIPNVLPKGNTFCHLAAKHGQIDVFEMLLNEDNNIDQKNDWDETPFIVACSKGRMNIVAMLLKKSDGLKINLDQRTNYNDCATRTHQSGVTGFHLACLNGHSEIAEMIMNASSRLKINLNIKDKWGATEFLLACMMGHAKIAKTIINNSSKLKIDLSTKEYGQKDKMFNSARVVEMLIEQSECHKIDLTTKNECGENGYQIAEYYGNSEVMNVIKTKMPSLVDIHKIPIPHVY